MRLDDFILKFGVIPSLIVYYISWFINNNLYKTGYLGFWMNITGSIAIIFFKKVIPIIIFVWLGLLIINKIFWRRKE